MHILGNKREFAVHNMFARFPCRSDSKVAALIPDHDASSTKTSVVILSLLPKNAKLNGTLKGFQRTNHGVNRVRYSSRDFNCFLIAKTSGALVFWGAHFLLSRSRPLSPVYHFYVRLRVDTRLSMCSSCQCYRVALM